MDSNKIDLDELAKTKPELAAAIKSLITDSEKGTPDPESLLMAQKGQSKRFSLKSLHPNVADVLSAFDFDGNGKVTVDEVHRGAELLKETKKKHKRAMWALVIQFVVYTALTAASCGVLYHFLYLMKDTAVDSSTGALMVKSNDGSAKAVQVSVKSHGKAFAVDGVVTDSVSGEEKRCVSPDKASEMFKLASEGTDVRLMQETSETGEIRVLRIGAGDISWTEESVDFGPIVLIPDEDCTNELLGESVESSENADGEGNRALKFGFKGMFFSIR